MAKHTLNGSERTEVSGSKNLGQYDLKEKIDVTLMLRRQNEAEFQLLLEKLNMGQDIPSLDRMTFIRQFGAGREDILKVSDFASSYGLTVTREDEASSSMVLNGTVAQFQQAFDVKLERYEHPKGGYYRGRKGVIHIPGDLHGVITAVLGLDNRPQARPHFRVHPDHVNSAVSETQGKQSAPVTPTVSFTPMQIASLYNFPPGDGSGQCIGIIELGGGYKESNLSSYFSSLGMKEPTVIPVAVGKSGNNPTGDLNGPDSEVSLDIEICGTVAPGAKIVVYFSNNADADFVDAINHAIYDTTNKPSVISISWGDAESAWTSQAMQSFNNALQVAALLGITVCVSTGDTGSSLGLKDGSDHVQFPASSPYVLSCGGTRLVMTGNSVDGEVAWNDGPDGGSSSGGVSTVFPLPIWQAGLSAAHTDGVANALTKRGIPDVAGSASPLTGYDIQVDGRTGVLGGTSAVAPLWRL